jgi:hypothetical protein
MLEAHTASVFRVEVKSIRKWIVYVVRRKIRPGVWSVRSIG